MIACILKDVSQIRSSTLSLLTKCSKQNKHTHISTQPLTCPGDSPRGRLILPAMKPEVLRLDALKSIPSSPSTSCVLSSLTPGLLLLLGGCWVVLGGLFLACECAVKRKVRFIAFLQFSSIHFIHYKIHPFIIFIIRFITFLQFSSILNTLQDCLIYSFKHISFHSIHQHCTVLIVHSAPSITSLSTSPTHCLIFHSNTFLFIQLTSTGCTHRSPQPQP